MPGLIVFRRRWSVGSDDLVVPGGFLFTIHFIWWVCIYFLRNFFFLLVIRTFSSMHKHINPNKYRLSVYHTYFHEQIGNISGQANSCLLNQHTNENSIHSCGIKMLSEYPHMFESIWVTLFHLAVRAAQLERWIFIKMKCITNPLCLFRFHFSFSGLSFCRCHLYT